MNDQQKQAIDGCMVELCESVKPTIFLPYLRMWNLLDRHECQLINGSLRTDAEKILETFDLIRSKAGSWEVLVKFLRDNKFVDLANKLLNSAGQGMEEDELEELVGQLLDLYVQNNMPASSQPPLIQTAPSTYPIETEDVFHLSAEQIEGVLEEAHLLVSLERYVEMKQIIEPLLTEVYSMYDSRKGLQADRAARALISVMEQHKKVVGIQQTASATLFLIFKENSADITPALKRRVVETILTSMESTSDKKVTDSCCLILRTLQIPNDIWFSYRRVVMVLFRILCNRNHDVVTQQNAITLLVIMATEVDKGQKAAVGDMGAVEQTCELIRFRSSKSKHDEVMNLYWNFLAAMTDDTSVNCERFVKAKGLELFLSCCKNNVAEVRALRKFLMNKDLMKMFCLFLEIFKDTSINYSTAGVIAHLQSEWPNKWPLSKPKVEEINLAVITSITNWSVNAESFITYQSFVPLLGLVGLHDCIVSQLWSIWTLAHLTTIDAKRYGELVRDEGFIPLLVEVVRHPKPSQFVKRLAQIVLINLGELE